MGMPSLLFLDSIVIMRCSSMACRHDPQPLGQMRACSGIGPYGTACYCKASFYAGQVTSTHYGLIVQMRVTNQICAGPKVHQEQGFRLEDKLPASTVCDVRSSG